MAYNYATQHTYCSTIDTGYELRVSPVEPYSKRYTRLRLPCSGSLGPRFPTFPVPKNLRYYAQLRLPNVHLRFVRCSLSSPDTSYCSSSFVIPLGLSEELELSPSEPGVLSSVTPNRVVQGNNSDLPSSQVTPMTACPALRPRWCPCCLPKRSKNCCLPPSP